MKYILAPVLMACGLAVLCLGAARSERWSVRAQETIERTLTLSGAPMRLVIDNVDGYVHVTGTNGPQVRVTAHQSIRAETDSDLQEAKNDIKLEMTEKPGSVSIYYDAPWRCNGNHGGCSGDHRHFYEVTYDIDVEAPREARLVVSTVNGGEVRVEKTTGDFDIGNVNGQISMSEVSGSGDVHTVNGPVSVHFVKNPLRASSFKTTNGQLDVYFQQPLAADLLFKTFNGQIYTNFDVTPRATPASQPEQGNGKFVYHSRGPTGGRVGGGGPELAFDTLNGNIRLHQGVEGVASR